MKRLFHFVRAQFLRVALKIWSGPWYPDVYCMVHSIYLARALYVATRLEIAELLEVRPQTSRELAQATKTHARSLYRVLRLLAAYHVFKEDRQGRFHLAKHGRSLLKDNPHSPRWWVLSLGNELWESNSQVLESVRTGKTGFELAHGMPFWKWYPQHPVEHDIFIKGMNNFTRDHCRRIVEAFDFGRFHKVVDVGGGGGVLIREILHAHPDLQGVLFDQPETVAEAKGRIETAGLADRCEAIGGDFFQEIPEGGDAYIFKHVLRDWDDASVLKMLANCHDAMAEDGTLLVIDGLVDPKNGTDRLLKLLDVQIMIDGGGGLRTLEEFERFFEATGFQLIAAHRTTILDGRILEARKLAMPQLVGEEPQRAAPQVKPESDREPVAAER